MISFVGRKFFIFFLLFIFSCKESVNEQKPLYNPSGKHIGDSILRNNKLAAIVFSDSKYEIDSILFKYNKKKLVKQETLKAGKKVFENIEYYDNGSIKRYTFLDEDNSSFYYERIYDSSGNLISDNNNLFFQGFIVDNINTAGTDIRKGTTIEYRVYFPNPPDCTTNLYIKNDDGTIYNVFKKATFVNFLQTVRQDNDELGTFKVNILMEQRDNKTNKVRQYEHAVIFDVI